MTVLPTALPGEAQDGRSAAVDAGYGLASADLDRDAPGILARWCDGLSHMEMSEQKLEWYYRANVEGLPSVFLLRDVCGREVGVAAIGCRRMQWGAQTIRAGVLFDFVLHERHRTLFPALFMQREMRRIAAEHHPVLFGFPNEKSLAVVKRAGYRHVGDMVRRTRVLRSARYLSRYLPRAASTLIGSAVDMVRAALLEASLWFERDLDCGWQATPDVRFDALWARSANSGRLIGVRDARFLAWRFGGCPYHVYRFFTVSSRADNRLLAYAACRSDSSHLYADDFLIDDSVSGLGKAFWRALAREAYRDGRIGLTVRSLGDAALESQFAAAGLVARGRHPVVATVHASFPGGLDALRWYLTAADVDT